MKKIKKDEVIKIIRAVGVSAAVVALCVWYRDSKIAEKQKQEDEAYVKEFAEYTLESANREVTEDTLSLSTLETAYSFYSKQDLEKMLDVMNKDSANYADKLRKKSKVVLGYRGKDFAKVLKDFQNVIVPYNNVIKQENIFGSLESGFASDYEQYKQNVKILKVIRKVVAYKK